MTGQVVTAQGKLTISSPYEEDWGVYYVLTDHQTGNEISGMVGGYNPPSITINYSKGDILEVTITHFFDDFIPIQFQAGSAVSHVFYMKNVDSYNTKLVLQDENTDISTSFDIADLGDYYLEVLCRFQYDGSTAFGKVKSVAIDNKYGSTIISEVPDYHDDDVVSIFFDEGDKLTVSVQPLVDYFALVEMGTYRNSTSVVDYADGLYSATFELDAEDEGCLVDGFFEPYSKLEVYCSGGDVLQNLDYEITTRFPDVRLEGKDLSLSGSFNKFDSEHLFLLSFVGDKIKFKATTPSGYEIDEVYNTSSQESVKFTDLGGGVYEFEAEDESPSITGEWIIYIFVQEDGSAPVDNTVAIPTKAKGYGTFCYDKDISFNLTDGKAYVARLNGNKVILTEVTEVPAGTGVLVKSVSNKDEVVANVITNASAITVQNDFIGVCTSTNVQPETVSVLSVLDEVPGFYKFLGDEIPANKAYLPAVANSASSGFAFVFDEADGIQSISTATTEGVIYNLNGQRVNATYKGVVIMNGKKYIK
jgi:hypothetical protein